MQHRISIGKRLKELRKSKKYSQQFVAENLFISQAAYSLIENSQNGIVAEHIVGLSNLYEVTTDYLLKGDKMLIRVSPSHGFLPYYRANAHAGFVKNSPGGLTEEEVEWYRIPGFNPTVDHKLFEVEGDSMAPTVMAGDIVICQKQHKWDTILDSSLVLLITKESILIKRFRTTRDEESMDFENDHVEDDNILTLRKEEIKEIMMVRGKISNVLITPHELASRGKTQGMEESIEFLKRELFSINKKLNSLRK